jgi:hypothetical protein
MIRNLTCVMLLCFLAQPLMAENLPITAVVAKPEQVVSLFQKLPHYELICEDKTWGDFEPNKVGVKFATYFSDDLYKLFFWTQCGKPKSPPPHYSGLDFPILWDIRFGFPFTALLGEQSVIARNIRVQKARLQGSDKAIVKVLYDFNRNNTVTVYTLIREDGQWKIDDISPKGDGTEMSESSLYFSESIKTDMQNNYNAAMERYNKELVIKGKKEVK